MAVKELFQELEMVKRIDQSVQQHLKKTDDLLLQAAKFGIVKTYRDRAGKLAIQNRPMK